MATTIKQHYVPQFYLRYFANVEGQLWVWNVEAQRMYLSNVRDVCEQKNLYETKSSLRYAGVDGFLLRNSVEGRLSQEESSFAKNLPVIVKRAAQGKLLDKDRERISHFIASLFARNPISIAAFVSYDVGDLSDNEEVRSCKELLREVGMEDEISSVCHAGAMRALVGAKGPGSFRHFIVSDLKGMAAVVLKPKRDGQFATSSFPPHFETYSDEDGIDHLKYLIMPLCPDVAIAYYRNPPTTKTFVQISDAGVDRINASYLLSPYPASCILAKESKELEGAARQIFGL